MNAFQSSDYFAIVAKKGHGKTTLGCGIDQAFPRRIVFDRMREAVYTERARRGGALVGIAEGLAEFRRGIEWSVGKPRFELIYRFPFGTKKTDDELSDALWLCYKRGSAQIKIEEIWFCSTPHYLPPALEDISFTGRHRGLSLLFTTQMPAQVNKKMLGQCEHRFYGRIREKNALNYLASELGDEIGKLPELKKGQFLWSRDDHEPTIISNR